MSKKCEKTIKIVALPLNELDITDIDNKIREKFSSEIKKVHALKKKLIEINKTLLTNIQPRMQKDLELYKKDLEFQIKKIESNEDLNFYTIETAELLDRYNFTLKTPIKLSFVGKIKGDDKEKNEVVKKYIEVAQKYYPIAIKPVEKNNSLVCKNCPNKKDFVQEENAFVCPECGAEQELPPQTVSYKDNDRVNITAKYTYDRKVHFRDCMNQYQGKQNCTIDQKVYDDLEDIFDRHHLLVNKISDDKYQRFSKITKEHILMFLKELGYSKHYENVNLIYYNLTGIKPDDISHLEDKLLADFDLLVETYDKYFKNKVERVNFISTQYVLYQLLQRYKHPCKKEDFIILKTMDRKHFHESLMRELFGLLSWGGFCPLY